MNSGKEAEEKGGMSIGQGGVNATQPRHERRPSSHLQSGGSSWAPRRRRRCERRRRAEQDLAAAESAVTKDGWAGTHK